MKALVGAFNQEKALVEAFSVITNLRMDLRFKLYYLLRANVVTTKTNFVYVPETTLDALVASWQLIVGIVTGAVVFIIILVVACKCNLFNRVRVYKQDEEPMMVENSESGEMEVVQMRK